MTPQRYDPNSPLPGCSPFGLNNGVEGKIRGEKVNEETVGAV